MTERSFLDNLNKYEAPTFWKSFARKLGIGPVWLVEDPKLPRSIRIGREIFINIRGDYWRNYQLLFNAQSYEESVVLKFLHEVGHIVSGHSGDPQLRIDERGISEDFERKIRENPLKTVFDNPYEREAWNFALNIRENSPELFQKLLETYKDWYSRNKLGSKV
ncbi:hypothetical protein DRP07_10380 [Archaeoglobales archaeon]|nr:MAG: hypothetical protein DRP07_10380 [Archaeoglobales archaeon]